MALPREISNLELMAYQAEETAHWGLQTRISKLLSFFGPLTMSQVFLALRIHDEWAERALIGVVHMMVEHNLVVMNDHDETVIVSLPQTS